MRVAVVTLFPEMVADVARWGVTGKALSRGQWALQTFNPRDYAVPPHQKVDDRPYGGGPGMVMLFEPLAAAISAAAVWAQAAVSASKIESAPQVPTVLLSPQGAPFSQATARQWSTLDGLVLVCGRYEGVDERILDRHISNVCSLGDFVLTGGELGALAITDAVIRLRPGVLNDSQSAQQESFSFGLLDHPHYTRPPDLGSNGCVPDVLLSGDHQAVLAWRRERALASTLKNRPDLLRSAHLSEADLAFLTRLGYNR
jgi:tRNA (guanine37-N1)-methyltransferase